jgi:uncharacterized protein (TIGR03083 family)
MAESPWPTIHAERKALAADLESLSDQQWNTPSLCAGWTVRDVLAHMSATAAMTPPKFFGKMIASGFRFDSFANKEIARESTGSPADTLAVFEQRSDLSSHPPGPGETWLGEVLVHAEDIRRPLGISHTYPTEALTRMVDFYRGSNLLIGGKKRAAGLTLRATDADWSAGSGPEVAGPAVSLMMAIVGRQAAVDELSGEGVATLKQRF